MAAIEPLVESIWHPEESGLQPSGIASLRVTSGWERQYNDPLESWLEAVLIWELRLVISAV